MVGTCVPGGGVTDSLSMMTVLDTWSVHVDRGGGGTAFLNTNIRNTDEAV